MAVLVEDRGHVRVVTIDRPERRNALDPATFVGLGRAFEAAEADDGVRVVVLTGTGDQAFCAGMDLKAFAAGAGFGSEGAPSGPGTEVFVERCYPKPIVAAVNGAAVGGGFGIVLACDLAVAAEHATFGLPEVKRGLVGAGSGSRAALRLPPAVAMELILTGEPMDASRALHFGLVNRVAPKEDVLPTALALAEIIAANGPLAVRVSKEIVFDARDLLGVDMAALREKASVVTRSADAQEGARAFAEKRLPVWTGR
jgi:enoyl-CoA hydratase